MNTKNISWEIRALGTQLSLPEHLHTKCGSLNILEITGPVQAYNWIALLLPLPLHNRQCPENVCATDKSK